MLAVTLRWTSTPSRGSINIPDRFMVQKLKKKIHGTETGISSGLMSHLARTKNLPYVYNNSRIESREIGNEKKQSSFVIEVIISPFEIF